MRSKKKSKQSRGYLPGDARGNFFRAWCGKAVPLPPYNVNPDPLRQFVICQCYKFPLTAESQQARFFTCDELVKMAKKCLDWPKSTKASKGGTDPILSAKRHMRKVCQELGIVIKPAPVGRRPAKK